MVVGKKNGRIRRRKKKSDFFDEIDRSRLNTCTARCPYFGLCGGCSLQDIVYEDQLIIKRDYLKKIFGEEVVVVGAPKQFNYRNRMDFVFSDGKLGLRKKGDFRTVIDLDSCSLIPEQYISLFGDVKGLIKEFNIQSYDLESHEGFLRYVTFRYAPNNGEVMVFFSTKKPRSSVENDEFVSFLRTVHEGLGVDSVYWQINDSLTDTAIMPHGAELILGKKTIIERIGGLDFEISPWSFFQNNSLVSEEVFDRLKSWVQGETIDCCCGVGTIGLFVADKAKNVTGIDEVPQSIDLANKNKKINGVENAVFFADDMKNLENYSPLEIDTMIIDPPRAGLNKKTIKKILRLSPGRIIYMSCNAKTQKKDIDLFKGLDESLFEDVEGVEFYDLVELVGFDMFPQTKHLETLAVLERRKK